MNEIDEAVKQIDALIARAEELADRPGTEAQIYVLVGEVVTLTQQLVAQKLAEKLPPLVANKLADAMNQLKELTP